LEPKYFSISRRRTIGPACGGVSAPGAVEGSLTYLAIGARLEPDIVASPDPPIAICAPDDAGGHWARL
jgi:hypothetical protein